MLRAEVAMKPLMVYGAAVLQLDLGFGPISLVAADPVPAIVDLQFKFGRTGQVRVYAHPRHAFAQERRLEPFLSVDLNQEMHAASPAADGAFVAEVGQAMIGQSAGLDRPIGRRLPGRQR